MSHCHPPRHPASRAGSIWGTLPDLAAPFRDAEAEMAAREARMRAEAAAFARIEIVFYAVIAIGLAALVYGPALFRIARGVLA